MQIVIGACGWIHEQWWRDYYPDDIPQEWCLSYYANEFQSMLVPYETWSHCDREEIQGWLDDLSENFQLYFELKSLDADTVVKKMLPKSVLGSYLVHFPSILKNKSIGRCTIEEGKIVGSNARDESVMLLRVSSQDEIKVEEIRGILDTVHGNYSQYEFVYLFFDGALIEMNVLNSARIIVDLLAISH